MEILPAIDLRDGKCVRLIQGQYDRQINYEDDPLKQARIFAEAGAEWLHIVDLDGALIGNTVNIQTIEAIASVVDMKMEVGGGIRNEDAIKRMFDIGLRRIIIGTAAVSRFEWFGRMAQKYPGKLALSLDAKGTNVQTDGWTKAGQKSLLDLAKEAANLPIAAIIYTDIARDGMMSGPNIERTAQLVEAVAQPVITAGGVTKIADIVRLKPTGAAGAIIGRALYEGTIDLKQAIQKAR